jgi:integrase
VSHRGWTSGYPGVKFSTSAKTGGQPCKAPAPTRKEVLPVQNESTKRRRHVPQSKAQHVYWSETAKGKVFEVRHPRNANGQRPYEVVGSNLAEAKARARQLHGDDSPRVMRVGLTLNTVAAEWRRVRQVRTQTATLYRCHVEPRFGRAKVREIDRHAIVGWLNGLQSVRGKPLAPATKKLILATLDVVLSQAVEMGALGANPVRQIPRKHRPRPGEHRRRILSHDEEARLLAYCAPFPWLRPIVVIALHEALRLGEALALHWENVDFAASKLHIRHNLDRDGNLGVPKSGKSRSIELMPAAKAALLDLRLNSGAGFVFTNTHGAARNLRDVQRAFDKARSRAALPTTTEGRVVFHSLRHTGISRLANHPAIPLVHVRDFAGHSDLAVTQSYVHKIESPKVTAAMAEALSGEAI